MTTYLGVDVSVIGDYQLTSEDHTVLSILVRGLQLCRDYTYDYSSKATAAITHNKQTSITTIALKCKKPYFIFETSFLGDHLKIVSVSLDKRARGKDILKTIMRGLTTYYPHLTLRAGSPSGYLVWLMYGFLPNHIHLKEYQAKGIVTNTLEELSILCFSKEGKSLIINGQIYFNGYLNTNNDLQRQTLAKYLGDFDGHNKDTQAP